MPHVLSLLEALTEPLRWLLQPDKRIFVVYLACAAALAAWVGRKRSILSYVFPRRIFMQRSSLLDVRLIFARAVLGAALTTPRVLGSLAVAAMVARALDGALGALPRSQGASTAVSVAFALMAFVADDLSSYLVHRAMHRVPALWELHKVHHSAEVMTPLTVYRVHPIEGWINQVRGAITLGLVAGAFLHFAPGPIGALTIAGVDVFGVVFSICGANLRHSHVRLSWGRRLEHLFISPAMHQLHHGRAREQHETNYGSALAVWDWIFGSLRTASPHDRVRFGLPRAERNHHPARLGSVLVGPLRSLLRGRAARVASAVAIAMVIVLARV